MDTATMPAPEKVHAALSQEALDELRAQVEEAVQRANEAVARIERFMAQQDNAAAKKDGSPRSSPASRNDR